MKSRKKGAVALSALMLAGVLGGCGSSEEPVSTTETYGTESGFSENSKETIMKTLQIEALIDKYYYFDTDDEKREEKYYDGIMAGLDDPYSVYYTKEEMKQMEEDDSGEYVGIGATVSKNQENGQIYVVKPLRGSEAEAKGILPEDIFIEIDGVQITADMELEEVVTMIRGSANSTAKLKMYRPSIKDYVEFEIPRKVVQNITVEYELLENGFGYILVSQFIENTADQFREAVDYLTGKQAKGLIIDMRDNPGGFTIMATDMADYLLADDSVAEGENSNTPGYLLEMRFKSGKVMQRDVCKDQHSVELPIAVLVNGNTASSSEIFSGIMKDYKKAILVGTKTYGKGIVQQVYDLDDGTGIKLTVGAYYLPGGENIHKEGLEPDVEVELSEESRSKLNLPHNQDEQLQRAIKELGGDPLP